MVRVTRGLIGACVGLLPLAVVIAFPPVAQTPTPYAQEMAAKAAIKAVQAAEVQYYSQYGVYATLLTQLGPNEADLVDADLASGAKGGFKFALQQIQTGYSLEVTPAAFGASGTHTYYSDQSMSIHEHNGQEPATASDPLLGETRH